MSANVNLTRGTDGLLYYQDNHGHWHLYSSLNYSDPSSYVTNQQYSQDPNPPKNPTYPEGFEYDEERAEAGREPAREQRGSSSRDFIFAKAI
ncbi:hypothetical protein CH35J_008898 [Colletotrichum higginsianum]|uniref:Uncharacterized protein n=1 Tax=Colletotrichum higginsianum TaxID=80884 RepID=A0A4T0VUQ7_9PEZI|nr:hypothetical protein CH35J_008898 [Colletotrichum higginsianum]